MDVEKLPRLLIESIEIEGPIQKEWPPASHKALFFDGDERQDDAYAREIFARFLPRAYRRPVTKAGDRRDRRGRGARGADRPASSRSASRCGRGCSACSARRASSSCKSRPAPARSRRPLNDYELASRLSYFLWSTMPDDELFAAGGRRQAARPGRRSPRRSGGCSPTRRRSNLCATSPASGSRCATTARCSRPPSTQNYDKALEQRLEAGAVTRSSPKCWRKNLPITVVPRQRFPRGQRTAGQALRDRRRRGAGVPPRGDPAGASSRRRARAWPG